MRGPVETRINYLLELKRYSLAEKELGELFREDPSNWEANFLAARILSETNRGLEALSKLRFCLSERPEDLEARSLLFSILSELKRFDEAESCIIALLKSYPECAELWARYAYLMFETGHLKKAESLVREGMRHDPNDEKCILVFALISILVGKTKDVEGKLRELISTQPECRTILFVLMAKLNEEHRRKDALHVAEQLVRLDPSDQTAIEAVIELRAITHWSMKPLWVFIRFGWPGAVGLWLAYLLTLEIISTADNSSLKAWSTPISIAYLSLCAGSWIWPPILKKILRR